MTIMPLEFAGIVIAVIGVGRAWKKSTAGAGLMVLGGVLFGIGYAGRGGVAIYLGVAWALLLPLFAWQRRRLRLRDSQRAAAARRAVRRMYEAEWDCEE